MSDKENNAKAVRDASVQSFEITRVSDWSPLMYEIVDSLLDPAGSNLSQSMATTEVRSASVQNFEIKWRAEDK